MELISHHLCPFLHRNLILLAKKGLKKNLDFQLRYVPIYDLPQWLFEISPKGSMPILRLDKDRFLFRTLAIAAYLDETIAPSFLPEDAFERAKHRALLIACGELLDQMRTVYTTKDENLMQNTIEKLFAGLKELENDLQPLIQASGQNKVQMVECAFAPFFTVMLNFDYLRNDPRWENMGEIRAYADRLIAEPIVQDNKCPDYALEFDRFFNHFGSAFKAFA